MKYIVQRHCFLDWTFFIYNFVNIYFGERIQKDAVDPEKLEATLSDESLKEDCDLKRATEMVAFLQTQLKEMNPNLDAIAEYLF
jgi:hypothetical protein